MTDASIILESKPDATIPKPELTILKSITDDGIYEFMMRVSTQ